MRTVSARPSWDTSVPSKRVGDGHCQRCNQQRPLFLHVQTVIERWQEEHDCPDCMGHDEETTRIAKANLCPRCYEAVPHELTFEDD